MTLAVRLSIGFGLAAGLVYVLTPRAIALATRLQFYDKPTGYKGHATPTPYLGGAAVMAGFVVALAIAAGHWDKTGPLLGGAAVLWLVGTIDDRRPLPATVRALLELALGAVVYTAGLGWHLHAGGALDLALTCGWVLAVVNAFNLFDNMDGAAATIALVVCAGAALIGVVRGDVWLASGAAALCGACAGFLPHNLAGPARIFLGDGGSMPVGFAAAVFVMVAAGTTTVAWRALLVALLLVAVPALDTTLVIVSRRRRGVSVLSGGRDHLTHRTLRYVRSTRTVALTLGVVQAALSLLAVLTNRGDPTPLVLGASLYVLGAGCVIVAFDAHEIEEFDAGPTSRGHVDVGKRAAACLLVLGLGAGISALFYAYFDASVWVPIGLAVTLLCAIAIVVRPIRPGLPAALSVGGALGLAVWSLISGAWAESVEDAIVSANRWLVYGALLALLVVLIGNRRLATALLAAATAGVAIVAATVIVRMLGSDPRSLFLGGRLNSPLGYINGEGCLFAIAIWPSLALAESRRALLAGGGAALATTMASLAMLSQSRGTALAVAGALLAVLALSPGRIRRAYAALVIGGAVALAAPDLLAVYGHATGGSIVVANAHAAARATLLAALAAGVAWGLLTGLAAPLAGRLGGARATRAAGSGLLVLGALAVALALVSAPSIERNVDRQWHAFTHLSEPGENATPSSSSARSRLLSGAGNRYDYWRIAWRLWREHPLAGVGAGNYARTYYEQRATTEDVEQPHSLELEVLSELGVVGALLLACLLGGVVWGAIRMRRAASQSTVARALLVGALGAFAAWFVQASVDWMALLPGLTAIALSAAAVLVWPRAAVGAVVAPERPIAPLRGRRAAAALGASAVAVTLIVAGASLSRQGLADLYRSDAQRELARRPLAALRDVQRSLEIDRSSVTAYYVKAAALARFDQGLAAEAALGSALAREPRNFVTWVLLGDVAVRRGDLAGAARRYRRAHALNPRDPAIALLARTPPARLQELVKA
jgi:UDP-N-acetylmuramyl pentapeptide phosphotransferase/UDP-N-acetylglucosamine-1-phosphate transferase/tetratricopeptide (TPR) repeat protein